MEYKLELVVVPVTDVDRAKDFYAKLGWRVDVDHRSGDFRVVQISPTGSACSIALMRNPESAGSVSGLHLVVTDIAAAREELAASGAEPGEPFHIGEGGAQVPGPHPERADYGTFMEFADPDGNGFLVQERGYRKPVA